MLEAWGVVLEMAWVEPAWAAHWLKRRRRKKQRKKVWFLSDSLSGPSPLVPTPGRGRLRQRGWMQVRGAGPRLGWWCGHWVIWAEKGLVLSLLPLGPGFGLYSAELAASRHRGGI